MFGYNKLRGRIREVCNLEASFATSMGMSKSSLSHKLNGKATFNQSEIQRAIEILGIQQEEIGLYFFTLKM